MPSPGLLLRHRATALLRRSRSRSIYHSMYTVSVHTARWIRLLPNLVASKCQLGHALVPRPNSEREWFLVRRSTPCLHAVYTRTQPGHGMECGAARCANRICHVPNGTVVVLLDPLGSEHGRSPVTELSTFVRSASSKFPLPRHRWRARERSADFPFRHM